MAWVAPDGFYFLFVTGACRTEQHAGSVRCVCFGSQSQNTPCSFLLCAPAEDKLRAPVIIPPRRNYDEIHTSGHLWTHCWLRGNHNSASVEVSEIVAWKHVVRSYVSMLRRGSDFGPAGFSVSENRFFIFHGRPCRPQRTKRVFSYFFSSLSRLTWQSKRYPNSADEKWFPPWASTHLKRVCACEAIVSAEGKKYQQVQYLPAFQVDSLGVCIVEECCCKKKWKVALV